jgi:hypothetical protein
MAMGAFVSLSRSAITNLLIAACIIIVAEHGGRRRLTRLVAMLTGMIAAGILIGFLFSSLGVLSGARAFVENKVSGYEDDAVNTRIQDLTIKPIIEWWKQPTSTLLFGDAVSHQHTFIANALWMGGVLELFCGAAIYLSMAACAVRAIRTRAAGSRLIGGCFLALVLAMFLDDSVANSRYESQFVAYCFYVIAGAFSGSLRFQLRSSPRRASLLVDEPYAVGPRVELTRNSFPRPRSGCST